MRWPLRRPLEPTWFLLLGPMPGDRLHAVDLPESLSDIEAWLEAMRGKLYHMSFRGRVARSTLAGARLASMQTSRKY